VNEALRRSGFVALAGRPNVGKSTLLNTLVGGKLAAVTDRPQTTRRAIRGVWTQGERQIALVDLPGFQRPRDALTGRMALRLRQELEGADAVLMILAADETVGPGDRYIASALARLGAPVTLAVNKIDRLKRAQIAAALQRAAELGVGDEIYAVSARTGAGIPELAAHLASLMPEGSFLFPVGQRSDQSRELLAAELIREAVISRTRQELPHALEVVVEEFEVPRASFARIRALIWVERSSQQAIVVGARGQMIKAIGSAARKLLETELGIQVHLDLSVRVRRGWRADEARLDRLGIT
jgi:GTP-binding protein Era